MVLLSNVTAALRAKARPLNVAPVFIEMEVSARIFPINVVPVLIVAELGTFHQTLQDEATPVANTTLEAPPADVMSVDADRKIQTPAGASVSSNVSAPVPEPDNENVPAQ